MSPSPDASRKPVLVDAVRGDATGLMIPAHAQALASAGAAFLTEAFRAFGSLGRDNRVQRILRMEPCPGGSTGAKLFLSVRYEHGDPGLHEELFVKFSRDFDDARRDERGRWEMAPEAPFAALSRLPGFPIQVPTAYFADYHRETGTGLIVGERIAFGEGGIEPQRRKCLDHETLVDPVPYYRATVTALARLCAAHKSGRLAADVEGRFPFDPASGSADPIRYSRDELRAELARCVDFAERCPRLLPEEVRAPEFLKQLERDTWRLFEQRVAVQRYLTGNPDFIALCHWNAHIDNCWFWRDEAGELACGLLDWGRVGQITLGAALWGALSAAHHDIWDHHLGELLELFVSEYASGGGPRISVAELERHLALHVASMGVARVLAFPEIIRFRLPECERASGPLDAMFARVDPARNCLHVYTVLLEFWRRQRIGEILDGLLERRAPEADA